MRKVVNIFFLLLAIGAVIMGLIERHERLEKEKQELAAGKESNPNVSKVNLFSGPN